jgi:N-acetylneuraminic acid mutarotase
MSKSAALLLVLIFLTASSLIVVKPAVGAAATDNSWAMKTPLPTARGYLQVAVVNGKIYAIGGSGPIGANEEYDPTTDTWATKTSMPDPQQSFAVAVCQGKIYCIGGLGLGMSADNKVYDPANDSWETKENMPTARYGLQANVLNGKIYCMGGKRWLGYNQGAEELNNNEVYDPSNDTWTMKASMPNPAGYVSAVVDNKIYVIGPGLTQVYDPSTDSWSTASPSPINITAGGANGIAAAAAATTGIMAPKRIYVYDESLQVYDPQNDSWTFGAAPPTKRQYLGIANVNDTLYFIGGITDDPSGLPWYVLDLPTNEQYTPIGYGTLPEQQPFPTTLIAASVATVAVVGVGLLVYLKKRKH